MYVWKREGRQWVFVPRAPQWAWAAQRATAAEAASPWWTARRAPFHEKGALGQQYNGGEMGLACLVEQIDD